MIKAYWTLIITDARQQTKLPQHMLLPCDKYNTGNVIGFQRRQRASNECNYISMQVMIFAQVSTNSQSKCKISCALYSATQIKATGAHQQKELVIQQWWRTERLCNTGDTRLTNDTKGKQVFMGIRQDHDRYIMTDISWRLLLGPCRDMGNYAINHFLSGSCGVCPYRLFIRLGLFCCSIVVLSYYFFTCHQ